MIELIMELMQKYPQMMSVLVIVGGLRIVLKPLMALVRAVTQATPTTKDDQLADKIEASKPYKAIAFVLDWLGSVKLPGVK